MHEREIARRMLVSVGIAMVNAEKLMEGEREDVKIFAMDAFMKLADLELILLNALGVKDQEQNPLARRLKFDQ